MGALSRANGRRAGFTNLRLLADELVPGTDLRRDASLAVFFQTSLGYLLCESLDEQLRAASVVEERQSEVDRISTKLYT